MEAFTLTKNQQEVFNTVETSSDNILIHGKPGVGKSVLINALVNDGNKTYTLAAPTGLAALNIGGVTLHRLFKLPVSEGIIDRTFNVFSVDDRVINNLRYNVKHLVIDEVSMVRADTFDFIDRLLRNAKGKPEVPFGGVQLILVGDFYQLPPVARSAEAKQLKDAGYDCPFLFSSNAFKNGGFRMLELNEVLRQKGDPLFIELLHAARTGNVKPSQLVTINKNVGFPDDFRIKLVGTNKQADEINASELRRIDSPAIVFNALKFGEWPSLPVEEVLTLKVGAQVMVKMNAADRPPDYKGEFNSRVVNGTIGKVFEIMQPTLDEPAVVTIELEDGTTVPIYSKRWERKVKERIGNDWTERVVASFEQVPLSLAWSISIHKSQGQSFDKVHIDCSRIFAPGQAYVALSRCRSIAGTSLTAPLDARKFWADPYVKNFFSALELIEA